MDFVTITESACRQLGGGDANELRAKVVNILGRGETVLEKVHNITREEREALDGLRKDDKIIVLPADKGRVTVVMDKQSYLDKCQGLLKDEKIYKKLKQDLTSNYQDTFMEALWDLKVCGVISDKMHHGLFPTTDHPPPPPHFYELPKVHKATMPL